MKLRTQKQWNLWNLKFFEKIKINKLLARLIKEKGEKTQITKIRNRSRDNTVNLIEVKGVMRERYKQL